MGVGAIIGGIGSLAAAGVSAAGQAGLFGGGAPKPQKIGTLQNISLQSPNVAGLQAYTSQAQNIPGMESTASAADIASNQAYQQAISSIDPSLMNQISSISNIASSYLAGNIPQDVQDQIQRATAQMSMAGGYGPTSGMGRNLTARDLGLTSLNLQQMGTSMAGTSMGMAQAMTPSFTPVSSLLFTPAQLLARTDQASYYNTDLYNQREILNSGIANAAAAAGSMSGAGMTSALSGLGTQFSKLFGSGGALNQPTNNLFSGLTSSGTASSGATDPNSANYDLNTNAGIEAYLGLPAGSMSDTDYTDMSTDSTGGEF
jgi:hypothetical protein